MVENQMDHPDVKIAPPVAALLHMIAAFVLHKIFPLYLPFAYIFPILGGLIALMGLLLAFAAVRELTRARTTIDPHGSVSAVVRSGPYQFTRNPIYLSFLCMLIGFPLLFGTFWGLILAPVFIFFMNRLVIEHEEAYLEKKFGDVYTSYKSRVRRWL